MKALFKCGLTMTLLVSLFGAHAEDDKKPSVGESIKKCISLVKAECKNSDFRGCSDQSKKKDKILECQDYLLRHARNIENKDKETLGEGIKNEIARVGDVNEDQQKCLGIYQKVCEDGQSMDECLKKKQGQFPSFCREIIPNNADDVLRQAGLKKEVVSECSKSIQHSCKLEIPEHQDGKDNMKIYRAATEAYQKCLQEQVNKSPACKQVVSKDKSNSAVQLIQ